MYTVALLAPHVYSCATHSTCIQLRYSLHMYTVALLAPHVYSCATRSTSIPCAISYASANTHLQSIHELRHVSKDTQRILPRRCGRRRNFLPRPAEPAPATLRSTPNHGTSHTTVRDGRCFVVSRCFESNDSHTCLRSCQCWWPGGGVVTTEMARG
jgi:hypothetical protein